MIRRRRFCAAAGMGVLMPAAAVAETPLPTLAATCIAAIRTQLSALPDGPVLLNSYLVETGQDAGDFDLTQANAAYVYDNALAGLALLAGGHRDAARRIGQALAIAQAHDRYYRDGRLRNGYQAGAMTIPAKLPGFWDKKANRWAEDPYQVGSQSGPIAWAMLLWTALGMSAPANRAGDWLDDQLRATTGYYGGFYGFEPNPLKLIWQSTEQNTDLYTAFRKLDRAEDGGHASAFVTAMFDPRTGQMDAGTAPDGARNTMLAADAGIWPYLAGLAPGISARLAIQHLQRAGGIGFSDASTSIWLEGTAFAALALGGAPPAAAYFATIARNISPQGYVYATVAPMLSTGLMVGPSLQPSVPPQAFNYYRRPALSTTAWTALAAMGINPLS